MQAQYVEGDLYDIAVRVREIDPDLSLSLNYQAGVYEITRFSRGMAHHVMNVLPGELHAGVLDHLRKNDLQRRRLYDFILELERSEEAAKRKQARELSNTVESITLDKYNEIAGWHSFACGKWGEH